MLVDEVWPHAGEAVVVELDADVEVDGQNGGLIADEELLGLLEVGVALGGVAFAGGGGEEGVVGGIFPSAVIVAAAGVKHVEEGGGIIVVADPTAAAEVVIEVSHAVEPDFLLLLFEADLDAEVLCPHGLEFDGEAALDRDGDVEVFDKGEASAAREAGIGEELASTGYIQIEAGRGLVILPGTGWREAAGGCLAELGDVFDDAALVHREGEGLADAWIGEGRACGIHADEPGAEEGARVEPGPFLELIREGGRHHAFIHEEVTLAGEEEIEGGVGVLDRLDLDGGHFDIGGIPVSGVFAKADVVVDSPVIEQVGSIADEVGGLDPGAAVALDHILPHGDKGGEGTEVDEVGRRILQLDAEGLVTHGTDSDGVWGGVSALGVVFGTPNHMMQSGVVCTGLWTQHAEPGGDKILRSDGPAICPGDALPQVEGVSLSVRGNVPALGHAGLWLASGV